MNWHWPWRRERGNWTILPEDIHWLGFETSYIVREGYEPFAVSAVPNTLDHNQIRVWTRRRGNKERKEYEIAMQSAGWGGHQVLLHLSDGWEPFAVSDSSGNHIIWFRREV